MLPDYFRDQLPDPIRKISDSRFMNESPDPYTHLAEYSYPIFDTNGQPTRTSLGWTESRQPMAFGEGQEICLAGVWVEVDSVETSTEVHEDDDREITFYDVVVRLPQEK
jgi:hypothetical protein